MCYLSLGEKEFFRMGYIVIRIVMVESDGWVYYVFNCI